MDEEARIAYTMLFLYRFFPPVCSLKELTLIAVTWHRFGVVGVDRFHRKSQCVMEIFILRV